MILRPSIIYITFLKNIGVPIIPFAIVKNLVVCTNSNIISRNIRREFASPKKIINPKNLPLNGKPDDFTGAVGDFNFNVSLSKEVLKANESSQIKIDISGKGNLKLFELPTVKTPSELEKYQPERKENIRVNTDGIQGSVNDTYTIVPQYKGKYKIPSVSFSYFNLREEKYKTISTADMYVDVIEGKEIEMSSNSSSTGNLEKQDLISTRNSFRYIQTKTVFQSKETVDFYDTNTFYLLLLLPFLAIPIAIIIGKRNEERNSDLVGIRLRKAEKLARKFLSEAKKQFGKKEAFYEALERALHNYLKAKLNIETGDISKENITQILEEKKVDVETISKFIEVLQASDFARYTPVTNTEMNKEFEKAREVIVQLDKQL